MKRFAPLLLLASCAPHLAASNAAGGIVNMTGSLNGLSKAMPIADAECRKFGKVAVSKGTNIMNNTMRYECVTP